MTKSKMPGVGTTPAKYQKQYLIKKQRAREIIHNLKNNRHSTIKLFEEGLTAERSTNSFLN